MKELIFLERINYLKYNMKPEIFSTIIWYNNIDQFHCDLFCYSFNHSIYNCDGYLDDEIVRHILLDELDVPRIYN